MNDKELLELAAKAYGIDKWCEYVAPTEDLCGGMVGCLPVTGREDEYPEYWSEDLWNPREFSDDAFMLSTKLGFTVKHCDGFVEVIVTRETGSSGFVEPYRGCKYKATRLAITRTAAEIGKTLC